MACRPQCEVDIECGDEGMSAQHYTIQRLQTLRNNAVLELAPMMSPVFPLLC